MEVPNMLIQKLKGTPRMLNVLFAKRRKKTKGRRKRRDQRDLASLKLLTAFAYSLFLF
jgi:hypothetical protein